MLSDNEIEDDLPISMIFFFVSVFNFNFLMYAEKLLTAARISGEQLELLVSDSEPEAPTISLKDKTKDVDVFFHPSEKVGGKPRRACILCKYI